MEPPGLLVLRLKEGAREVHHRWLLDDAHAPESRREDACWGAQELSLLDEGRYLRARKDLGVPIILALSQAHDTCFREQKDVQVDVDVELGFCHGEVFRQPMDECVSLPEEGEYQ